MIFSDEKNLYIKHGFMDKMLKILDASEVGMYLTIRSFEFETPEGVEMIEILKSSSDGFDENKKILERLIKKGYAEKLETRIKTTNKTFD
ncbi:hypothetical protein [Clostridium botulinum]|uniref:hypothetical protein n=1 Tax=Clostridium botulinum TaxID=1491 RepID=UPI000D11B421|nr:hypothetical protein [Clostridium botulinum]AVQ47644.1 hypothetical protein C7M60_18600 [Clostridium botulinum]AVQ51193.1 hypothetical protein C7M58_18550 [Clostridium botulinum]